MLLIVMLALAGTESTPPAVEAALSPAEARIDGIPSSKAEAIWQIEVLRLPAASLASFLSDADPRVRARAVRAVGRLRESNGSLTTIAADENADVRYEVAFALGQIPASAPMIRTRWGVETDKRVRRRLADALGRQGDASDLDGLVAALAGPDSAGAAEGIGRLGLRKIEGVTRDKVVAALLGTLKFPIGDTRRYAAWALSRMGLTSLSEENRVNLWKFALTDADPNVRAWLVRAGAGAGGPPASLNAALMIAATDHDVDVRISAARALAKGPCGNSVSDLLTDPEAGVRIEAIGAAGACKNVDIAPILHTLGEGPPPERAAALRALVARKVLPEALPTYVADSFPINVRIAAVESSEDRRRLMQWAKASPDARIRSAAASVLLDEDNPRPNELIELLGVSDVVIAQGAADTLKDHPDPTAEPALLELLRRKELPRLVGLSAVKALDAIYETGRLPRPGPDAVATIKPWLSNPELKEAATRLATILQLPPPRPRHPDVRLPPLADVMQIRSARVFTTHGEVRIELAPEDAPLTVWNFATLAEKHYFDGLVWHRVVPGFVVQTGDPRGDGWGGPGYEIPDEMNDLSYTTGAVGMALSGPDTGGSQWFITLGPHPHLDGGYTVFGHVSYGMDAALDLGIGDVIDHIVIERANPPVSR